MYDVLWAHRNTSSVVNGSGWSRWVWWGPDVRGEHENEARVDTDGRAGTFRHAWWSMVGENSQNYRCTLWMWYIATRMIRDTSVWVWINILGWGWSIQVSIMKEITRQHHMTSSQEHHKQSRYHDDIATSTAPREQHHSHITTRPTPHAPHHENNTTWIVLTHHNKHGTWTSPQSHHENTTNTARYNITISPLTHNHDYSTTSTPPRSQYKR